MRVPFEIFAQSQVIKGICILSIIFLMAGGILEAKASGTITVTDSSYRTLWHIEENGTVTDSSYRTIAHLEANGTITNSSYQTLGRVHKDEVSDSHYRTLGHIRSGTVSDSSYRTIGHYSDTGTLQGASYETLAYIGGDSDKKVMIIALFYFFRESLASAHCVSGVHHVNLNFSSGFAPLVRSILAIKSPPRSDSEDSE